jgi:predicted phage terminase large subunit-like protein
MSDNSDDDIAGYCKPPRKSRFLNDKQEGCIITVMQRLHEDDLVGHLLAREGWTVLRLPAIAEEDEEYVIDTIFGRQRFTRRAGDLLHPERESQAILDQIRQTIGSYNFAGQYQQAPAPFGGGMVKEAWFRRYELSQKPRTCDRIVQSWDTANKPTELGDYSVCTTWGLKDKHFYLLNVFRKKLAYPDLKRAVREQAQLFNATVILIEDKASGTQLIQELIEQGLLAVTRYKPEGDKVMRLHAQTATIENGFVLVPSNAHWLADYMHELTTFPNGKYDDQVDSTSQALAWAKQRPSHWGLLRKQAALFNKFRETGMSHKLKYNSVADLRASYPDFFWKTVRPYIGDALRYLRVAQDVQSAAHRNRHGDFISDSGDREFHHNRRLPSIQACAA